MLVLGSDIVDIDVKHAADGPAALFELVGIDFFGRWLRPADLENNDRPFGRLGQDVGRVSSKTSVVDCAVSMAGRDMVSTVVVMAFGSVVWPSVGPSVRADTCVMSSVSLCPSLSLQLSPALVPLLAPVLALLTVVADVAVFKTRTYTSIRFVLGSLQVQILIAVAKRHVIRAIRFPEPLSEHGSDGADRSSDVW